MEFEVQEQSFLLPDDDNSYRSYVAGRGGRLNFAFCGSSSADRKS